MLEDIRLRPIDPFFRIEHLADEKAMMLVKHFRGVVSIFTDSMCVIDILPDEIKNPKVSRKFNATGEDNRTKKGTNLVTEIFHGRIPIFPLPAPPLMSIR